MYERRKGFFGKAFWFVMSVTAVVSVTGTGCAVPGDGPSPPKIVATPRFSPPSGSYSSDQTVIVDCSTDGAVIHYTTDGTDPTEISSEYDIPIPVSGHGTSMTIKAMALKTGWEASSIITATYTINYLRVSTPQFDPAPGTYTADQEVSIDCATEEAVIHYTTDGTEPDASSPEYTGPVTVAGHGTTMTIRALAVKTGMIDSENVSADYEISYPQTAAPVFDPAAGEYYLTQRVGLSTATAGATIRYTTDGTDPTPENGQVYSLRFYVSDDTTVKAIAYHEGMLDSEVVEATYTFTAPPRPDAPSVTVMSGALRVSWTPLSPAIDYDIYWAEGDTVSVATGTRIEDADRPTILDGLTNGTQYAMLLVARNSHGESLPSEVTVAVPEPQWQAVGGYGFTPDEVKEMSMAFDTSGRPLVAFDKTRYGLYGITVMRYNGSSWDMLGDEIGGDIVVDRIVIAMDGDTPYIAARHPVDDYHICIWRYTGADWEQVPRPESSDGSSFDFGFKIHDHHLYVAYDNTAQGGVAVTRFNGTTWEIVGDVGFFDYLSEFSFAIDEAGVPYMACQGSSNPAPVTVMRFDGSDWVDVGPPVTGDTREFCLAVHSGVPFFAFRDPDYLNEITVLRWNGSVWEMIGPAGFTQYQSANTFKLAFSGDGTPYVCFRSSLYAGVMKWNGTDWESVGPVNLSRHLVGDIRYSFGVADDIPYLAFQDGDSSYKGTVLQFQ